MAAEELTIKEELREANDSPTIQPVETGVRHPLGPASLEAAPASIFMPDCQK